MATIIPKQVSVILISFNNSGFIFEALDSIFNQTYSNIQLIISDDASERFNLNKIRRYVNKHKKANVTDVVYNVNEQNLGTVKHLEIMREKCTGEMITVIAADDAYADAQALEWLMDEYYLHNGEIGVISSVLEMCDKNLGHTGNLFTSKYDISMINSDNSLKLFEELSYRCILPSSGTIIAPRIYEQLGSLSDDYKLIEDWSYHTRMARMGIKIRCIDKVTVLHRDGGISHGNDRAGNDSFVDYVNDLATIYEKEVAPYCDNFTRYALERAEKKYTRLADWRDDLVNEREWRHTKKKKIVFFFRKGVVAKGDFALYYCIAAQLAKKPEYTVFCVNNYFPELKAQYLDSGINFISITDGNRHLFDDATFVTAVNQVFFLLEELKDLKHPKILLLFLHPQIIDWLKYQLPSRAKLNGLGKLLCKKNAYGFMDFANYAAATKKIRAPFQERYFPVVINNVENDNPPPPIISDKEINIAWLGRLDGDKISSLWNFLDNIKGFDFGKRVTIHLIGDGNASLKIGFTKYAPQMRFVFNSYLYDQERDDYLLENADLVVAMGLSAVYGGILKIPTILPIVSADKFRDNKFILLSDTKNYSLGVDAENIKALNCKTYLAHKIVETVYAGDNKRVLGQKCYDFIKENFIVDAQIDRFEELINETRLTASALRRLPLVSHQLLKFRLYRKLRGQRIYADYLIFRGKLQKLLKMKFKDKLKFIKSYLKRSHK